MAVQAALLWLGALELAGACLFALAMIADLVVARRSAATRRGVWALAIAVALVLPLARLALGAPALAVAPRLALGLWTTWAIGALVLLVRLALGVRHARRLRADSEPLTDPAWQASLRALQVHGPAIDLRVGDELASPVTIGVWRPAIVVPRALLGSAATGRRSLLAHELAHVARADALLRLAGAVARAIYWPDPLAWVALQRLRARAEDAADDAVLDAGVPCSSYAAQLVAVARAQLQRAGRVAADGLRARVCSLLDVHRVRGPARPGTGRAGLARLAGAAVLLATLVTACEARSDDAAPVTIPP
jgi:hypothetical protein